MLKITMPDGIRAMTLNLTEETQITFSSNYNSIAVRAENECGVSEAAGKNIGDDNVLKCNAGESVIYANLPCNKVYLVGSGSVEIFVGNNIINPFKNGGRGGGKLLHYLGVTTTALTDGSSTNPITINNQSVTAKEADWAVYNSKDFIFNGTVWQEVGDLSDYYTKSETDTLLSAKANAVDVYTKAQADNTFIAKTDLYISDTPTSAEISDAINTIWG